MFSTIPVLSGNSNVSVLIGNFGTDEINANDTAVATDVYVVESAVGVKKVISRIQLSK